MSAVNDSIRRTYDDFPYLSSAFANSAPEHLRAVAHVFGLASAPPRHARVLELGCAAAGNLLPFAARWPQAEVVGVDLSPVQIAAGQAAAAAMGLHNVRLLAADLGELEQDLDQFDYIVAHGVYSWVPAPVREQLLRICRERLAPTGVAYVSYNVYPGWKSREVVRDAMLLDNHERSDPAGQLERAREMIEFLHRSARPQGALHSVLEQHLDTVRHGRPHYLAHEYLEICNDPCYFQQFVTACQEHRLSYLAEAEISSMFPENYGLDPREPALRARAGDPLAIEQLLDFVTHRSFRQSLLCHAERIEGASRLLRRERLRELHLAGRFNEDPQRPQRWRTGAGGWVQSRDRGDRQLLQTLHEAWPASVSVEQLLAQAGTGHANPAPAEQAALAFIEELVSTNALHFRLEPMLAAVAGDRPRAPKALRQLAAWQADDDAAPVSLFNAWHESILDLAPFDRRLLALLDGRHDRAALRAGLLDQMAAMGGGLPQLDRRIQQGLDGLSQRAMLEE